MKNNGRNSWEDAYNKIHDLILGMEIKPGEAITEISLSKRLGIGRTPIREALKKIEHEGLIFTTNHRKRIYILTLKELEEIFDIKICLESYVAECAAKNCNSRIAIQFQKALREMELAVSIKVTNEEDEKKRLNDWLTADQNLHHLVFKIADKPKIEPIIRNLDLQWQRLRLGIYTLEGRMNRSYIEHRDFIQAIIQKNPADANQFMRLHLLNVSNELIKLFKMFNYPSM
jgi:DNA-binding GntR family transcriptional regulator